MLKNSRNNNINRIIDANFNRVKEGFRVCEEITRFILSDRKLTAALKKYRHDIDSIVSKAYPAQKLLKTREVAGDVGRANSCAELERNNLKDIFWANMQRVKESLRVLEEFSKLVDIKAALRFKQLRYKVYEIEKKTFKRIASLPNLR